jgi:hypothetical protein
MGSFPFIIQSCGLCGANAFEYITELQRHAGKVYANPSAWMPWNYRDALKIAVAVAEDSS